MCYLHRRPRFKRGMQHGDNIVTGSTSTKGVLDLVRPPAYVDGETEDRHQIELIQRYRGSAERKMVSESTAKSAKIGLFKLLASKVSWSTLFDSAGSRPKENAILKTDEYTSR